MTRGDVVSDMSSKATMAYLTIQPAAGIEWVVHNIYHEAEVGIYIAKGTDYLLFGSAAAKGSWSAHFFHLTNTHYLLVQNTNVGTKLISYDGIVTKE